LKTQNFQIRTNYLKASFPEHRQVYIIIPELSHSKRGHVLFNVKIILSMFTEIPVNNFDVISH